MADAIQSFPPSRPGGYDPDLYRQPGSYAGAVFTPPDWDTDHVTAGGGRWNQQLVVIGKSLVYYEALE
jgi:hypothetical protein